MTGRFPSPAFGLLALAIAACWLVACERIQPVRTLPSWVRGIYIPMVRNSTTEPGLEEVVTRLTQEAFLSDGRVDVVAKRRADLQLIATIKAFRIVIDDTDSDEIAEFKEIRMLTDVALYDPYDPERPVADLGTIMTNRVYAADPRSVNYVIEPVAKERALDLLARQIVARTISGFPRQLRGLPKGARVPRDIRPASQRGNVFQNRR